MEILHTIEGMGARLGGIATCTYDLLQGLSKRKDANARLLTLAPKNSSDKILGDGYAWLDIIPNDGIGPVNFSRNINRSLSSYNPDVYHVNGMWQYICHATACEARRRGKPYVITPHGMLYPTALRINAWKKWPMRKLWFNKDIMNASAFHATCETEMIHLRNMGYKGPIAVLGNPVTIPDFLPDIKISKPQETTIGFLGRLHPIKRIETIIQGAALSKTGCKIIIIGSGDNEYEDFLRCEAKRLGISDRVIFTGFLNGQEKFEQLAKLSALFITSEMENFGMIVPEALLVGTPVVASLGTPWQELEEYRCGWWRSNSPESLAEVIQTISALSQEELTEMGMRGRDLVLKKYEASRVASNLVGLYGYLLGKSDKPEYVFEQ